MKKVLWLASFLGLALLMPTLLYAGDSNPDSSPTYALQTGKEAGKRLDLQHKVMEENSLDHIQRAGIKEGQTVFDIGCGSGAMTIHFAQKVGDAGHVYAIDISQEQLDVTKAKLEAAGYQNVLYHKADILDISTFPKDTQADMIYTRYVLMHLTNPQKAIENIKNLLKEGGVAVDQESIMCEAYTEPTCDVVVRFREKGKILKDKLGVNHDIGKDLQVLYESAGFASVETYRTQYHVPVRDFSAVYSKSFAEMKPKFIEHKIMTPEEADSMEEEMKNLPHTHPDSVYHFEQAHVIARSAGL